MGAERSCHCSDGSAGYALCAYPGVYAACVCTWPSPAPVANAGADRSLPYGAPVMLDGSLSYDPGARPIAYQWEWVTIPNGSTAVLSNATSATPTFVPDRAGDYTARLVVSTDQGSVPDVVTIRGIAVPPVAVAGNAKNVVTGNSVTLDGSASSDGNGDVLSYAWTVTTRPPGSTAPLTGASSANSSFTPDVDGSYTLSLVVNDGALASAPSTVVVAAFRRIDALSHAVLDAEYSNALGRIVTISTAPNVLHLIDPTNATEQTVALPTTPTAVSVGPDGKKAAVGHNGFVSYIDLELRTVIATHPVTTNVIDVVLAGNGYVYAFPRTDQWETIRCVRLSDGKETLSSGYSIYAGTLARLHPDGLSIYGADNGLSPSDIEKYSLGTGTASRLYDSPYHGDYAMCGNLWFSDDGAKIFTRCGNVFNSTASQSTDMTYAGALDGASLVRHVDHAGAAKKVLAILDAYEWAYPPTTISDKEVRIFGDTYFAAEKSITLPSFLVGDSVYAGHGRFVFANAAGTAFYVIVQADTAASLSPGFGLVSYVF